MNLRPPQAWDDLPFFRDTLPGIEAKLAADARQILPPQHRIFAALDRTPPDDVRVVILGQDPYPTPGHAHGFAFSTEPGVSPLPRSLSNIFKELEADTGARPATGDLRFWADQGVLLLNTCLTVPAGAAGGHARLGWQVLTAQVLDRLAGTPRAWLLWGAAAHKAAGGVDPGLHLKIATAHPSPLSARRGFFGSRPFSRANAWLQERGHRSINWADAPEAP